MKEKPGGISFQELFQRKSWRPLPAVAALVGEAEFLRREVERRFIQELFGNEPLPSIQRFDASRDVEGLLAHVLDELRTLSILSAARLAIVQSADAFLASYREALEPFVSAGFEGGHLLLHLDKAPDERTRFAKTLLQHGWLIHCRQPYDRPPPWKTGDPPWRNELSEWIAARAAYRGLSMNLETAYFLQERAGTELGTLDECLEKIGILLGPERKTVTGDTVAAVTGEIREDSIFDLAEAFIGRDRVKALSMAERLNRQGYHPPRGNPIFDPATIASLFIGSLIARLRPLRRAHALQAAGGGPDRWLELRLTTRPFIERFRRDLAAMPPGRIDRIFKALLEMDRSMKSGGDPQTALAVFIARN
ncbi:MAG: hypothetical protein HY717_14550 [Planctomycetes bacterium]|nr:hypothetical protein [Planctomycetota bacterium]